MQTNVIRRISVQATSQGVAETTGQLDRLAKAQGGVAVASDKTARSTLSVERALEKHQRRLDADYRATRQLQTVQRDLNAAQAQGLITLARKNELMTLAAANSNRAAAATTRLAAAQRSLVGAAAAIGLGGGLAIGGIIAGQRAIGAFIEKSIEQQRVVAQLEQAIKSTGGAAGLTASQLTDMASALQGVTTYGDEAIIPAQALLLTFTKIGKEVFPQAIETILDMSTAMGQDLKSSTVQIGKALNDPVKGITALTRVGVSFTEAQKEMIKSLAESGRVAEAQTLILRELQTEFGGSARAARNTLGGALEGLSNAFGDLFEVSSAGSATLTASINNLTATLSDPATIAAIQSFGAALLDAIAAATEAIRILIENASRLAAVLRVIGGGAGAAANLGASLGADASGFADRASETATGFDTLTKSVDDYTRALEITIPVAANTATETDNLGKSLAKVADVPTPKLRGDAIETLDERLKDATASARSFAAALASGLVEGEGVVGSLASAVGSLSSGLGDAASGFVSKLGGGGIAGSLLGGVAGGVVGSLASGLGSIVADIFGNDNEELKQARDAWREMRDDFKAFRLDLDGGSGSLAAAIDENRDKFHDFAKAARDAGKDISGAKEELVKYERRLKAAFRATFDGTIASLKAGEGLSGSYAQGLKDAQDLTATLLDFIKDAQTAFGKGSSEVKQARKAARDAALGVLRGDNDNSAYMAEYQRLTGAADALRKSLKQLGMTSKEAAAAVKTELTAALAGLKADFESDLKAKINDAIGLGYNNDVAALIAEQQSLLKDAATFGTSASLVNQYFQVEAQSIIDQAELTGDAFDTLIKTFPQLSGVVHEFTGDLVTDAKAIRDATASAAKSITEYVAGLYGGSQSTLSPIDRLNAAQSTYQSQLALAQGGNVDALQNITTYAEDFRSAARDFYASSQGYQDIFQQITADLLSLPAVTETAGTDAALDALRTALVDELAKITSNTAILDQIKGGTDYLSGIKTGTDALTGTDGISGIKTGTDSTATSVSNDNSGVTKWTRKTAYVTDAGNKVALAWLPLMAARLVEISTFVAKGKDKPFNASDKQLFKSLTKGASTLSALGVGDRNKLLAAAGYGFTFQHGGIVPGYAAGGIVGNGIFGRDSVLARHASGGMIGLAGGEGIITAQAVQRIGASAIDQINRGRMPVNDNSAYFEAQNRVLMAGFDGLARVTATGLARIEARLGALERRDRIEASRAPRRRKAA